MIEIPAHHAAWLIRAMLGPALPDPKSPDEQRWEDDGGALTVRCEGYTHTITAVNP